MLLISLRKKQKKKYVFAAIEKTEKKQFASVIALSEGINKKPKKDIKLSRIKTLNMIITKEKNVFERTNNCQ